MSRRAPRSQAAPFDPADWPISWMARAERQHARNSNVLLAPLGLQHREFRLLAFLGAGGSMSVGELAEAAVLERPTVSKMLGRLELEGWVDGQVDPSDGRRIGLVLTASGRSVLRLASERVEGLLARYDAGVGREETDRLMRDLRAYFERVKAAGADTKRRPPAGGRDSETR